jgi:hypothetical protein
METHLDKTDAAFEPVQHDARQPQCMKCDETGDSPTDLVHNMCSKSQFHRWKETRLWLSAKRLNDGFMVGLTCKACSTVGSLFKCMYTKERISISHVWLKEVTTGIVKSSTIRTQKSRAHEASIQKLQL